MAIFNNKKDINLYRGIISGCKSLDDFVHAAYRIGVSRLSWFPEENRILKGSLMIELLERLKHFKGGLT